MRKSHWISLALVSAGGLAVVTDVGQDASNAGKPAASRTIHERMILPQGDLIDEAAAPAEVAPAGEFRKTVRSLPGESRVEFLARRSYGRPEGEFAGHSFLATVDRTSGRLIRFDGTIDLGTIVSQEKSLVEMIRASSAFGASEHNVCRFTSVRIHKAVPGQLPNRADTLIEGRLTIGGKTLPMSIAAKTVMDAEGQLTLQGEFAIDRKAYGLPVEPRAEGSIRDELVVRLNLRTANAVLNASGAIPESKTLRMTP